LKIEKIMAGNALKSIVDFNENILSIEWE